MWLLILLPTLILAQRGEEALAGDLGNIEKLYGIASKIMPIVGNFMGGGGGGSGYEEVRPRFQGVRSFSEDNSILSSGSGSGMNSMTRMIQEAQGMFANANFVQATTTTQKPNTFKSIFDSFLGTGKAAGDDDFENLPPPPTPKPRQRQNLFNLFGGSSNNAESAPAPKENPNLDLLYRFLPMGRPTTTTTTTEASPVAKIMNLFVPPPERQEPEQSSGRGRINFLELFGMAPRTTTTTTSAPPLQALFAPNKPYNGSPEDLDGIMNALLRSNAKPASKEPASFLSQFFGGRK